VLNNYLTNGVFKS